MVWFRGAQHLIFSLFWLGTDEGGRGRGVFALHFALYSLGGGVSTRFVIAIITSNTLRVKFGRNTSVHTAERRGEESVRRKAELDECHSAKCDKSVFLQ